MELQNCYKLCIHCYSCAYVVRESAYKSTTSPFSCKICTGTCYISIISLLSLIEQLSTYDVERKYLCYTGNSNDEQFPDEISKYVDANDIEELRKLVEQMEQDKHTTLTSKASLTLFRAIAQCKEYLSKNSRTAKLWIQYIHYKNIAKRFIRVGRTGN